MRFLPYRKDLLFFNENTKQVGIKSLVSDTIEPLTLKIKDPSDPSSLGEDNLRLCDRLDFINFTLRLEDQARQGRALFIVFYNDKEAELCELVFDEMINKTNPFFVGLDLAEMLGDYVSFQYALQTTEP